MRHRDDLKDEEEIRAQFEDLVRAVESATGLTSRWNGSVSISDETIGGVPRFKAKFAFTGELHVHRAYLGADTLLGSLLHEAFHAVSVGVSRAAFLTNQGFEEGVVEQAVLTFAEAILGTVAAMQIVGIRHAFPEFTEPLERIRALTGKSAETFYPQLLQSPLAERANVVVEWVQIAHPEITRQKALALVARDRAALLKP